jgi:hypothetical protein
MSDIELKRPYCPHYIYLSVHVSDLCGYRPDEGGRSLGKSSRPSATSGKIAAEGRRSLGNPLPLNAAGAAPQAVAPLPDRSSQILGTVAAAVLGLAVTGFDQ